MMIEPTETESKATLDAFADALLRLARQAETHPEAFATMPETTAISRVDETRAARGMILKA
jgi:glycine dehydrogenase subunit 2